MSRFMNWQEAIVLCTRQGRGYVIATVVGTQGSTPRDGGSKMVITDEATYDTLGGGQLEFLIVQQARELLVTNQTCQVLKPFPLAAEAAQCCGGHVTVMMECFAACDWPIVLFGAGHVSRALTTVLGGLPCRVEVVDNRQELMDQALREQALQEQALPDNVHYRYCEHPEQWVTSMPDSAWVVVFTHDHALDFRLCEQLLSDPRWRFFGLIGSQTKALRFRKRLEQSGHDSALIDRMVSPVGLPEVKGKRPMEVAVSIAAQLQSLYYSQKTASDKPVTTWREVKTLLKNNPVLAPIPSPQAPVLEKKETNG